MLTRRIPIYHYETTAFSPLKNTNFLKAPFYMEFCLPEAPTEEMTLLSVPGALTIRVIKRSLESETDDIESIRSENCFYFNEKDEWILESLCTMMNDTTGSVDTFALRLPLSAPFAHGKIGLAFSGAWIRYVKDEECLNENSGLDRFAEPTGALWAHDIFASAAVAAITDTAVSYREFREEHDVGFYSPYGWNTNVGDVMNFYHDGVYHLLYLFDRRYHRSRNGKGAHYITQITSRDLVNWEEQPITAEIRHPWESHGTGTMLWHNGKYYLSYGLHSERYVENQSSKMGSADYDSQTGAWTEKKFEDIEANGQIPTGATYAESDDGIHFKPSDRIFHLGRNPSAYNVDGKVVLYSGYVSNSPKAESNAAYVSDGFGFPFVPANCPNCFQKNPPMKHTTECPSLFEFGGYKYALLGFTGYYRTLSLDSNQYVDVGLAGESIYDGLCVPMVAPFGKDRRLISGWLAGGRWGSVAVHRELILEENGVLGMKWVPEMVPQTEEENLWNSIELDQDAPLPYKDSYLITATVAPNAASRLALVFCDENQCGFEFCMDFTKQRIQVADAEKDSFAREIPAMHEILPKVEKVSNFKALPRYSKNFCLSNITCMEAPFLLRILCRYSKKQKETVLDAEIAGRRTLVSIRHNCFPKKIRVLKNGNAKISNASLSLLRVKPE